MAVETGLILVAWIGGCLSIVVMALAWKGLKSK